MITPPVSSVETDFNHEWADKSSVSFRISELKQLIDENDTLIDKRISNLNNIGERIKSLGSQEPDEGSKQAFNMIHYKLTDFLVKMERKLEDNSEPKDDPIQRQNEYATSPHELKRNRQRERDHGLNDSRYDNSFELEKTERDLTINETFQSLTSIDNGNDSPSEAVALLQTYLNSILNIIKPNLKNNFSDILESTGELVNSTPLNAVNVNNLNEMISSIESTIGAFTI